MGAVPTAARSISWIEILADGGTTLVGIEVKASVSVGLADFRHLDWFAKEGPGRKRPFTGVVIYVGDHTLSFGERRFALPIGTL